MLLAIYIIKGKGESVDDITEILNLVTSRTQYKTGCLQSSLWRSDDRSELMLFETWNSRADLEKHIGSAIYKKLLLALDMASEKPVIRFSDCENIRGMELIEEVMLNRSI